MIKSKKILILFMIIAIVLQTGCGNTGKNTGNTNNKKETVLESRDGENQSVITSETVSEETVSLDSENANNQAGKENTNTGEDDYDCNVWVLDVGQGSSTLIKSENEYMLVDGGDSDKSSYVVSFLKNKGVDKLKYVIATHYDSDHLNGVVGALNVFEVENVICPEYTATSRVYESFTKIVNSGIVNRISPKIGDTYSLGKGNFTIIAPAGSGYSNVNDYSVGIKYSFEGHSMIIAGDATSNSEKDIVNSGMDISADVYFSNHHGSSGSNSSAFINKINPKYAIISVGKGNSYGHPTMQTLKRFRDLGIDIFRTDKQGEISFVIGKSGVAFDKEPYNELEAGNSSEKVDEHNESNIADDNNNITKSDSSNTECNYILNASTKKIHKPNCSSVSRMNESNKIYFDGNIEDAIEQGYEKCKNCFD